MDWVDKIGDFKVEKIPVNSGSVLSANPSFCIHTTEGPTYADAIGTIKSTGYAPHFTIGDGRIAQMRALSQQGAALRAHNDRFIQVECVGFSSLAVYNLTPGTWEPLVALTRFLHDTLRIPLYRPPTWPDLLGSFPASNNSRRQDGYALTRRGVYGHVDIPDQSPTWHWDPGSLNYTALFEAVQGDEMAYADFKEGATLYKNGKNLPAKANEDVTFGYNLAKRGAELPDTSGHVHMVTPKGAGKPVQTTTPD